MPAYARLEEDQLIVGNDLMERRWSLRDERLTAVSLVHKPGGVEWLRGPSPAALSVSGEVRMEQKRLKTPVSAEFLRVHLSAGEMAWDIDVFDDIAAITLTHIAPATAAVAAASHATASGIEQNPAPGKDGINTADLVEALALHTLHRDFIAVEIREQTDIHENLVFERRWMLHPAERFAQGSANVFAVEDRATGAGILLLKHAPAPHARSSRSAEPDVAITETAMVIRGHGLADEGGRGYPHTILCYAGGSRGRTAALQMFQQRLRPYAAGRDGMLLSNTWGDRNRDAAICEPFLIAEADAGARLGVDVLQIDDGWQKGRTANSAFKTGAWTGFWSSDPQFWEPDPERLPRGMAPLTARLKEHGMSLGLWFAPDSSDDCGNWQRDADLVLRYWGEHGARHVKIDAVKMHSKRAEANVARFYEKVLRESAGEVTFDSDVTAEVRPGFWGNMDCGAIFVENRYTDWHRYWPHHTLRNLWLLSHYIPPVRLRMEFLNVLRNSEKYQGDPLAPANYSPDTLFATVMFSSPLAWFEVSRLAETYFSAMAPLVTIWKQHRAAIHASVIQPIGHEPDGFAWTGFMTEGAAGTSRYALIFNELSNATRFTLPASGMTRAEILHGPAATIDVANGVCHVSIAKPLSHAFVRFTADRA